MRHMGDDLADLVRGVPQSKMNGLSESSTRAETDDLLVFIPLEAEVGARQSCSECSSL